MSQLRHIVTTVVISLCAIHCAAAAHGSEQFAAPPSTAPGTTSELSQLISTTLDISADRARTLHVGDFVGINLHTDWPVPYTRSLVERCQVLSVGDTSGDKPLDVEFGLTPEQCAVLSGFANTFGAAAIQQHLTITQPNEGRPNVDSPQVLPPVRASVDSPTDPTADSVAGRPPQAIATSSYQLNEVDRVRIVDGEAIAIESSSRITQVLGFRDAVLEVRPEAPALVHLRGLEAGTSPIEFRLEDGSSKHLRVEVITTAQSELESLLTRLYPDLSIEVVWIRDSILLRGQVPDDEVKDELIEITRVFTPAVLDQLQVAKQTTATSHGGTTSLQIPKGMRVLTISVDATNSQTGVLRPSDRVDLLVTYSTGDSQGRQNLKTNTLLEYVEVFATDTKAVENSGRAPRSDQPIVGQVSLLVPAEHVAYVKLAESIGRLALAWRRPDGESLHDANTYNVELIEELRALNSAGSAEPPSATLQDDIRALHGDVKRLIELLERRQADQKRPDTSAWTPRNPPVTPLTLPAKGRYLLSFEAPWCGPCQQMQPILLELANQNLVDGVLHLDVDKQSKLARAFNIDSLPTFLYCVDGQVKDRHVGATSLAELQHFVGDLPQETEHQIDDLGVRVRRMTAVEIAQHLGSGAYRGGVWINSVNPDGPAARVGIRPGDILVGLHAWETASVENLRFTLAKAATADLKQLRFYVRRDGETLYGHFSRDLAVKGNESSLQPAPKLERWNGTPGGAARFDDPSEPQSQDSPDVSGISQEVFKLLGLQLRELTPEVREHCLQEGSYRGGLRIEAVDPDSRAAKAGLRAGDILVGLIKWETKSFPDLEWVLSEEAGKDPFAPMRWVIVRDNVTSYCEFMPPPLSGRISELVPRAEPVRLAATGISLL